MDIWAWLNLVSSSWEFKNKNAITTFEVTLDLILKMFTVFNILLVSNTQGSWNLEQIQTP
jgi:hypothetical protein